MQNRSDRGNCFDLIRHGAALTVLYSHHFALLRMPEPQVGGWETLGFLAVAVFFSISGYFMPASFIRSANFAGFITRRLRRLLPGLVVCTFICTYVIGVGFVPESPWDYLKSYETLLSFISTSIFMGRDIPGAFSTFLFPNAINGSLWTLPIEFMCYLIIGTALSFSKDWRVVLGLFVVCVAGAAWQSVTGMNYSFYNVPLSYLLMFGICFYGGALLSMTGPAWQSMRGILLAFSLLGIIVARGRPEINVIGPLAVMLITIIVGTSFSEKLIGNPPAFNARRK